MLISTIPNLDKPEKTKNKKQNSNNSKDLICHLSAIWRIIFVISAKKNINFKTKILLVRLAVITKFVNVKNLKFV